jgi:hypothetical protein
VGVTPYLFSRVLAAGHDLRVIRNRNRIVVYHGSRLKLRLNGANVNTRKVIVLSTLCCASFLAATTGRASGNLVAAPNDRQVVVLKLSDLRSAYLLREGVVHYDSADMTPDGIRRQLQRHFNTVLGLLTVATPRSIETALDRLEAASGTSWTSEERAAWRQRLLANRFTQMQRLAAYRDRGLFPQNEGQADHPVPIFVDRHDTACAVGHLLRLSGAQDTVTAVEKDNNLVYVPDAGDSAIARWVLGSGLTLEEAALIQPGYGFNAPYLISDYESGKSVLLNNGLKYENFHVEMHKYNPIASGQFHTFLSACGNSSSCGSFIESPFPPPSTAQVGFNAGAGILYGVYGDQFDPVGSHWISLGGEFDIAGNPSNFLPRGFEALADYNGVTQILLSFDISTLVPNTFINQFTEHSFPTYGGFHSTFQPPNPPGQFEMTTTALASGSPLGVAHAIESPNPDVPPFFDSVSVSSDIAKASHLTVSTSIWLYNGEFLNGYVLGFQMVPEPGTIVLCALCAPALLCFRRHQ